ncbi:hypothetical protein Bca52824_093313 [Brassica carinata]|uniref:Uncharacterized protein n=1 Tax=Brassica carinata TaxID=52824 RepID=A0A8X7P491_BRACI|nr:hypothetical protein Bca52824_093313 [Brassica carinata]
MEATTTTAATFSSFATSRQNLSSSPCSLLLSRKKLGSANLKFKSPRSLSVRASSTSDSLVTLLDYGAGNVRSIRNALRHLGFSIKDLFFDSSEENGPGSARLPTFLGICLLNDAVAAMYKIGQRFLSVYRRKYVFSEHCVGSTVQAKPRKATHFRQIKKALVLVTLILGIHRLIGSSNSPEMSFRAFRIGILWMTAGGLK